MARLLAGLILGAVATAAGVYFYLRIDLRDPCLQRCGPQTRCEHALCLPIVTGAAPSPAPGKKRRHTRHTDSTGAVAAPEERLRPGDERVVSEGDKLGRPEHIDLSKGGEDGRELSQEALDQVFQRVREEISSCIGDAIGDAPLESGRVEIAFRVDTTGAVTRMRISAPQLLIRKGLSRCVRPLVAGLVFPKSGGASVVTYPFQIQ